MAVGLRYAVGTYAPETGCYMHLACQNTEIFNKGNILAPCAKKDCPSKEVGWILLEKLFAASGASSAS